MPPPPPLPSHLAFLLSIIPRASTYEFRRFDPSKMVELLRNVQIHSSAPIRQGPPQQPPVPGGQQWPQYPPQSQQQQQHPQQPPMIPPGMPPRVAGLVPSSYAGKLVPSRAVVSIVPPYLSVTSSLPVRAISADISGFQLLYGRT